MDTQQVLFASALVFIGLGLLYKAHVARNEYVPSRYNEMEGKKLKRQSAYIDNESHALMIEFKVGANQLGICCKMPKFDLVVPYTELHLVKTRALIGSLVQIKIPYSEMKFEISHKLAKKIEGHSGGKFGYKNI